MQNDAMPSGDVLRHTTCLVAENMFGRAFDAADEQQAAKSPERIVALRLNGAPDFAVVVGWKAADLAGLQRLFCGEEEAGAEDQGMVLDALGELLNIVAGQLKTELALEHRLGLPTLSTEVPGAVQNDGKRACSGWVQQRGGGPALFVGAYPSSAVGLAGE